MPTDYQINLMRLGLQAIVDKEFVAWVDGRMQAARYAIAKAKEVPQ